MAFCGSAAPGKSVLPAGMPFFDRMNATTSATCSRLSVLGLSFGIEVRMRSAIMSSVTSSKLMPRIGPGQRRRGVGLQVFFALEVVAMAGGALLGVDAFATFGLRLRVHAVPDRLRLGVCSRVRRDDDRTPRENGYPKSHVPTPFSVTVPQASRASNTADRS